MTLLELSYYLFTVFNGLRLFSYLPQIYCVARDANGASAISYATWALWTAANTSTGAYALINLDDWTLAVISTVNAVCCAAVIALTAVKRQRYSRSRGSHNRLRTTASVMSETSRA